MHGGGTQAVGISVLGGDPKEVVQLVGEQIFMDTYRKVIWDQKLDRYFVCFAIGEFSETELTGLKRAMIAFLSDKEKDQLVKPLAEGGYTVTKAEKFGPVDASEGGKNFWELRVTPQDFNRKTFEPLIRNAFD